MSKHVCSEHGFVVRVKKGVMEASGNRQPCISCDAAVANAGLALADWAIRRADKLADRASNLRAFGRGAPTP